MPRFKLTVEYDGTPFVGWQRQDNGLSVQEVLETAASKYCQAEIAVAGAGRTDAGVHALAQVCHLDIPRDDPPDKVAAALNALSRPHPVAVLKAEPVAEDFHARFSAVGRAYEYRIVSRRAPLALDVNRAWWIAHPLDAQAMHDAAQVLVGRHDFSTFRAAECQADSAVKTLDALSVTRRGEEIAIAAAARSFLHHQVRNIVGTLKLVGEGKWRTRDVERALEAKDRSRGGQTAPACGLYLTGVRYP
ncbi:MAG: tRNA pseudouridine(38-40) synthase TruA [Rhodospirillaceae bacterium]|nr:tRNA pseudouridine(38-40) synthase TruA [Rhodospirillaceae bacterium]